MKRLLFVLALPLLLTGCILQFTTSSSTSTTSTGNGGVFVSLDRGETWEQRVYVSENTKGKVTIGNVNVGFFAFDPTNSEVVYVSTLENGIWKSEDTGGNWQQTTLNQGYVQGFDIDSSATTTLVAGVGNTVQKSTDGGTTWETVYTNQPGNTITQVRFDPSDDQVLYATTSGGIILKSLDQGKNWRIIYQLLGGDYVKRLTILASDTHTLYALTSQSFYRSTDRGATWSDSIGQALRTVSALPVNDFTYSDKTPNVMYVAVNAGLFRSTDAGSTWKVVPTVIPANTVAINSVALNPFAEKELYFTAGSTFYKSIDTGATWQTLKNVSTTRQLQVLVSQPRRPGLFYLGTYVAKKK